MSPASVRVIKSRLRRRGEEFQATVWTKITNAAARGRSHRPCRLAFYRADRRRCGPTPPRRPGPGRSDPVPRDFPGLSYLSLLLRSLRLARRRPLTRGPAFPNAGNHGRGGWTTWRRRPTPSATVALGVPPRFGCALGHAHRARPRCSLSLAPAKSQTRMGLGTGRSGPSTGRSSGCPCPRGDRH